MSSQHERPWPRLTVIEVVSVLVLLSHAIVLAVPPATFALSINYRVMQSIAPEELWSGGLFAILGLGAFGYWRKVLRLRQIMLTIVGLCLVWMGVSFFLSNVNTTIGYTLAIVGFGALAGRVALR